MASSSHLTPGESGKIKAAVRTAGKRGRLVKTVKVISNDPERPFVTLRLEADVKVISLTGPDTSPLLENTTSPR